MLMDMFQKKPVSTIRRQAFSLPYFKFLHLTLYIHQDKHKAALPQKYNSDSKFYIEPTLLNCFFSCASVLCSSSSLAECKFAMATA